MGMHTLDDLMRKWQHEQLTVLPRPGMGFICRDVACNVSPPIPYPLPPPRGEGEPRQVSPPTPSPLVDPRGSFPPSPWDGIPL